jgi:hypothetical protein
MVESLAPDEHSEGFEGYNQFSRFRSSKDLSWYVPTICTGANTHQWADLAILSKLECFHSRMAQ